MEWGAEISQMKGIKRKCNKQINNNNKNSNKNNGNKKDECDLKLRVNFICL